VIKIIAGTVLVLLVASSYYTGGARAAAISIGMIAVGFSAGYAHSYFLNR
jgi:hypothetical protein